jgi:hypothetical protein
MLSFITTENLYLNKEIRTIRSSGLSTHSFYEIQTFISVFTKHRHVSAYETSKVNLRPHIPLTLKSILILSSRPLLIFKVVSSF